MEVDVWTSLQVASLTVLLDLCNYCAEKGVCVESVITSIMKCHLGSLQLLEYNDTMYVSTKVAVSLSKIGLAYLAVNILSGNCTYMYFPAVISPHYKVLLAICHFGILINSGQTIDGSVISQAGVRTVCTIALSTSYCTILH